MNWRENPLVHEILKAKLPEPGGGCNMERIITNMQKIKRHHAPVVHHQIILTAAVFFALPRDSLVST
jgi:hypothetical protein